MLLKNIILITIALLISISPAVSQDHSVQNAEIDNPQNTRVIVEENFSCFQSLKCLQRENPFKKSNLNEIRLNHNGTDQYVVEGSSKNESMHAVYNSSGELIRATVVQRNIPTPRAITEVLATGEFTPWKIIGNELVIENFDKETMQYKMILQNEGEVRVEHFDRNGRLLTQI